MQLNSRKKNYVLVGLVVAALLIAAISAYSSHILASDQVQHSSDAQDSNKIEANFRVLSQAHTDVCAYIGDQQANANYVDSLSDNYYLQGSCCTPMAYNHYVLQIEGLKNYSNIAMIPQDPYNVSASLAKQLMAYEKVALTPSQQAVYGNAVQLSGEGPCCCQCWAWYAHEGLARELVSQYNWNAHQIVNLWDLEDCCGG